MINMFGTQTVCVPCKLINHNQRKEHIMSRETLNWLNNNTLIGFTDKRGHAWHYDESEQGDRSNHFTGPVPVSEVEKRLFNWEVIEAPIFAAVGDELIEVADRKAMIRSDNNHPMGIFSRSYQGHNYREWLINNVSNLLDADLGIASAGLLKGGAQAWVQVEVPENIVTAGGVTFRPFLMAATSFDGSLATTYKRGITNVVCDNTMAAGLAEEGEVVRIKHTAHSLNRIGSAREALGIVYDTASAFEEEVRDLTSTVVTPKQWQAFLDAYSPIPEQEGRGRTVAGAKQDTLKRLWNKDERVAPWKGSAWGVVQAVNTYAHHEQTVRGNTERAERNMINAVKGEYYNLDREIADLLSGVLTSA